MFRIKVRLEAAPAPWCAAGQTQGSPQREDYIPRLDLGGKASSDRPRVVMHNLVVDLAVVIQNQPNVMLTITTATRMERGTARISPASRNRVSLSLNNRYASYACFVGRSCEPLIRFQGLSEPPQARLVPTAVLSSAGSGASRCAPGRPMRAVRRPADTVEAPRLVR